MNNQVKGDGQETNDTMVLNMVVGRNTNTHSVDIDQLMWRGINDPRIRGEIKMPYTCSISETNIGGWFRIHMEQPRKQIVRLVVKPMQNKKKKFMIQRYSVTKNIVEISLQLCAKSPTLDQWDLRVDFMVQGKISTFNYKQTTTNICFIL